MTPNDAARAQGLGRVHYLLLLLMLVFIAACSIVPNMDPGTSGCANARGIGR